MSPPLVLRRHGILGEASLWACLLAFALSGPGGVAVRAGAGAPSNAPEVSPPSLLVITIDTWRWDYIGASGAGKVETPNLDRLAREGVYEPEAVTPCPLTTPAHAALMTGLGPLAHGIWDCTIYRLAPGVPTLAEAFQSSGYRTAAFVSSETLKARYGLGRGFDLYDDSGMARRGQGDWMAPCRDGEVVTDAFLQHLATLTPGRRAFVWLHYFDLHLPHRPRAAFDRRYPRDPYAAQAAFVDGQVGRVCAALRADGSRAWRIVVVGDHGEGLGEKGEDGHGIGLYRATLHVPLILSPKPEPRLALPRPWGLVDLSPTLREWFSLPPAPRSDGSSLFQREKPDRALAAVSIEPTLLFGATPSVGVRQGPLLYLKGGREELFDLAVDPAQARDLAGSPPSRGDVERLRTLCERTWRRGWLDAALPPSLAPSAEELKNLQSLGYIGGSIPAKNRIRTVDVREVMRDRSDWDRAREEAYRTGKSDGLLALYARLVAKYPASLSLRDWYGPLLARSGHTQEAIAQMEEAVRLYPRDTAALTSLGALYMVAGRFEAAQNFLTKVLELEPENRNAHKQLGILYADHLDRPDQAVAHYQAYLDLGGDADAPIIRQYIRSHGRSPAKEPPR